MKKSLLERFISKYNLSGGTDGVTWKADKKGLSTKFISDDKHVIGTISTKNITLDVGDYSIYDTPILRGLMSVLDDDITITVNSPNGKATSLTLKDGTSKVVFVLADPSNIAAVPALKTLPDFENVITLDKVFVERFIKAKGALSDVETFTVLSDGKVVQVVLGYDSNNTNRITLAATAESAEKAEPIDFHARYMKEILSANREATSGKLEVSSQGLARITFVIDDFDVTYYLPQVKRED